MLSSIKLCRFQELAALVCWKIFYQHPGYVVNPQLRRSCTWVAPGATRGMRWLKHFIAEFIFWFGVKNPQRRCYGVRGLNEIPLTRYFNYSVYLFICSSVFPRLTPVPSPRVFGDDANLFTVTFSCSSTPESRYRVKFPSAPTGRAGGRSCRPIRRSPPNRHCFWMR